MLFGVLALTFLTNQYAAGLALAIFGSGLSAMIGNGFGNTPIAALGTLHFPVLSDLPLVGPLLFRFDILVYFSVFMVVFTGWFLYRTKAGLVLRTIGESPEAAHAIGYPVIRIRYLAVLFGGAMAGLAGAYLSVVYTPLWVENMTAGRGWIALALVVFSTWRPYRVLFGAWLFGGMTILQLQGQVLGIAVAVGAAVGAALHRDDRRAGDHLAQPAIAGAEFSGIAGQAVQAGGVAIGGRVRAPTGRPLPAALATSSRSSEAMPISAFICSCASSTRRMRIASSTSPWALSVRW